METTESKYLKKLVECRKLKEKCAYQEAMIEQMMSGCDGKCALHECICEKDQRLIDLKEDIAQLEFEKSYLEFQRDEFEKAANSWMSDCDKLKEMIEAKDDALMEVLKTATQETSWSIASCTEEKIKKALGIIEVKK